MKQLKIFTRPERLTWKGALASVGALALTCSGGALAWQANGWSVYKYASGIEQTVTVTSASDDLICPASAENNLQAPAYTQPVGYTLSVGDIKRAGGSQASIKDGVVSSYDISGATIKLDQSASRTKVGGAMVAYSDSGDLRSLTAGGCIQSSVTSWIVGGATIVGSSSTLYVANPGNTTVNVKVTAWGASGEISLPSDGQLSIAPGKATQLALENSADADPQLALRVQAEGGRVAAWVASQKLDGESAAGSDIITSTASAGTSLTIGALSIDKAASEITPQAAAADATATPSPTPTASATATPSAKATAKASAKASSAAKASATPSATATTAAATPSPSASADSLDLSGALNEPRLRVLNPGDKTAHVKVTLLGKSGPVQFAPASGLNVKAGQVADLPLGGLAQGTYGVKIDSDQPVSAAALSTSQGSEYPELSGQHIHDFTWSQAQTGQGGVAMLPRQDVTSQLLLTNPSAQPKQVTLSAIGSNWTSTLTLPALSTQVAQVPESVQAVSVSGAVPATLVSRETSGDQAGTLISVIDRIEVTEATAQRRIRL
ncbi:MAG: hypothetical protein KH147_02940 [Actinomyces graevenitzii]|nr:hypothetical protein [Actinomyces graevenitzii]